jgi:hypothetical protein
MANGNNKSLVFLVTKESPDGSLEVEGCWDSQDKAETHVSMLEGEMLNMGFESKSDFKSKGFYFRVTGVRRNTSDWIPMNSIAGAYT